MIRFIRFLISKSVLIEIIFRNIYWKFNLVKYFNFKESSYDNQLFDFNKIIENLKRIGVKKGTILIVHSSFDSLSKCGLKPNTIINKMINLIGEEGTLVMNSARILKKNNSNKNLIYDIQKSVVWTGVLPYFMIKDQRAEISEFPFNPIVAIGKHAERITSHNFQKIESSCGPYSGWKFCSDNNAIVVGLGVNLTHSLTIMHVAEENHESWQINDWYEKIEVEIINKKKIKNVVVKNRKEKWGKLYFLEKKLEKDLKCNNILFEDNINGLHFSYLNSKELVNFLNKKNHSSTYPYFIPFYER